jgi:hypothetical protein
MALFSLKVHFCTYLLGTKVSLPLDVIVAFVHCVRERFGWKN